MYWRRLRFIAPDRVEIRSGHLSYGERTAADPNESPPQVGSYQVTETGVVEQTFGAVTRGRTVVIVPAARAKDVWAAMAFLPVAHRPGSYRHEHYVRQTGEGEGHHVISELSFAAAVGELDEGSCDVLVHVRVQLFRGAHETQSEALDVYIDCRVKRVGEMTEVALVIAESKRHPTEPWIRSGASDSVRKHLLWAIPRKLAFKTELPNALYQPDAVGNFYAVPSDDGRSGAGLSASDP